MGRRLTNRIKNNLALLFDPTSITVAIALFNLIVIWTSSRHCSIGLCFLCPWYCPWGYTNPSLLLFIAACAVRFKKWWGYVTGAVLSLLVLRSAVPIGIYLVGNGELLRDILEYRLRFLFTFEGQWMLAAVIFVLAMVSLIVSEMRRRAKLERGIQHALGADSPVRSY